MGVILQLAVITSLSITLVAGAEIQEAQTRPNYDAGYCYYCDTSTNLPYTVPPLCVSDCQPAVESLCGDEKNDLKLSLQAINKNCKVLYKPATYPLLRNGARAPTPSRDQCKANFNQILSSCVSKNGGRPRKLKDPLPPIHENFCTVSGGGGTFGWKDDGWVMDDQARYIITPVNTAHCGQTKAFWQNPDMTLVSLTGFGVAPGEQILFGAPDPIPSAPTAAPEPNPECDSPGRECTLFNKPYYAMKGKEPWAEGGANHMRHQILYNGFSNEDDPKYSSKMFYSLADRCGDYPGNFQGYMQGPHRVIDFDLRSPGADMCRCIEDAIFDASGGLVVPEKAFCGQAPEKKIANGVASWNNVVVHDELRH